jgi:hypothetical protein
MNQRDDHSQFRNEGERNSPEQYGQEHYSHEHPGREQHEQRGKLDSTAAITMIRRRSTQSGIAPANIGPAGPAEVAGRAGRIGAPGRITSRA